jgi:hypothetical protein
VCEGPRDLVQPSAKRLISGVGSHTTLVEVLASSIHCKIARPFLNDSDVTTAKLSHFFIHMQSNIDARNARSEDS